MRRINFEPLAAKLAAQVLAEPANFGPDDDVVLIAWLQSSAGEPMPAQRKSLLQHSRGFVPARSHSRAEVAESVRSIVRTTIPAHTMMDQVTRTMMRVVDWRLEIVRR